MKQLLLAVMLLSGHFLGAQDLPGKVEEYFDFWLGKWEVSWDEGEGKVGKGTNYITKILDDKVIQENFEVIEGQSKGFKGTSLTTYQSRFNKWRQAWADNQGGYYDFTGKFEGDKRIFQTGIFDTKDGKRFTQRMIFYNINNSSLTWDWESSNNGGETWNLNWRINYMRMEE